MSNARNIASGAKFVDTAGDNMTGNLGINNASPSLPLHIKGTTNTNAILGVESANWTTGATAELRLAYTAGHNRSIKGHHDNGLQFFTNPTNPSLQINNSGHVTMPNQPFVRLELSSHSFPNQSVSYPGNQVVGFTVRENVGNHWNSSNNNFTCPVAGVYTISVFFIKFPVTGHAHVDLHKNGSLVNNSVRWRAPEINNGYHQAGGTVSVTCAANDVIDWHYFGDAGVHNTNGAWQIMLSH